MVSQGAFFDRFKGLLFVVLAVVVAGGVAALLLRKPEPTTITVIPPGPTAIPTATAIPSATPTPGPYAVYVTGAVLTPEAVVTLPYGSRVLDALAAVGGALDSADMEQVNLAQRIEDGDHIHVPTRESGAEAAYVPSTAWVVTATPGEILVYVVGAVAEPERMVSLPAGSRVEDAIEAVGGAAETADLTQVNLSQRLNDGDLVFVPDQNEETAVTPTPNHVALIHINEASGEELENLPGIGPSLAQAIVDYRTEHGPFHSLEEMDAVPGLGPTKLEAIREYIVFD